MRALILIFLSVLALVLTACGSSGAVVFAPTPAPPQVGPLRYTHPTGAFTVDVPREWSVYAQNFSNLASAAFSRPGADAPIVVVAAVNAGADASLPALINRYQESIRPDTGRYIEQDRQAMGDGSWRFTGIRSLPGGELLTLNTFIVQNGPAMGVIELVLPADESPSLDELERIVNTFTVNAESPLEVAGIDPLALVSTGDVVVTNVSSWVTPAGVFFVTGEVLNNTLNPIAEIPVRVQIFAEDGTGLAEARDRVMGYGVPPGGFAPFSLRFGQGQPDAAQEFRILIGDDGWTPETGDATALVGGASLTWRDEWTLTEDGQLLIEGEVTNTGDNTVSDPLATITAFDTSNRIVATGFRQISAESIAPGESVAYTLILPELGGIPSAVLVNIQAIRQTDTQ